MKEGFEGFIALALLLALTGCAANQQRAVNDAYASGQQAKAQAVAACAQSARVASCMLGVAVAFGGGNSDSVPVVQSDLATVLNSSALGAVVGVAGQVMQSNNATKIAIAQTNASVRVAESGDARQVATMQAATGSNERISAGGFSAITQVAGAGLGVLGNAAQSASAANAANVLALAGMPPTTQIIAGRDVIQARNVDQSVTGRDRDVVRQTNCVAQGGNGAPATTGNQSATGGATSPLTAGYNPLLNGGNGASGANNCGGG